MTNCCEPISPTAADSRRGRIARVPWWLAVAAVVAWPGASPATAQLPGTRVPGACDVPVAERPRDVGCYLVVAQPIDALPDGPLYWHIYAYHSREAAAQTAASPGAFVRTVAESLGRVWLFALARADWRATAGEHVATIGPLPAPSGSRYVARYMEAVFPPGMQTSVHRHSGPEAWYLVSGAQCLQTPDSTIVARAGRGAVVPAGPPMRLTGIGAETRRSLVLVLHDASQPWMTVTTDWAPATTC